MQLIEHKPEAGLFGDCHRTCIAMILDMNPADVPHFCRTAETDWQTEQREFLASHGLASVNVPFEGKDGLQLVLDQNRLTMAGVPMILGGASKIGDHSVALLDGEILDPMRRPEPIVGPMSDGYYWLTILAVGDAWSARTDPLANSRDRHEHFAGDCCAVPCDICQPGRSWK